MIKSRFLKEHVIRNSFRILGISSLSSKADVNTAIGGVKRKAKLGVSARTPWDMLWLGEPQRSESDIQYALSRLSNPSDRLVERFFWPSLENIFLPKRSIGPISSKTFEDPSGQITAKVLGYEYEQTQVDRITAENVTGVSFRQNLFGAIETPTDPFEFHDFLLYRLIGFSLYNPTFGEEKRGNSFPETSPDIAWEPKMALRTYIKDVVQILGNQAYWDMVLQKDNESGFEPRSTAEDVAKAKNQIMHLLALDMLESNFYEQISNPEGVFKSFFFELTIRPEGRQESSVKAEILSLVLNFFSGRISREITEIENSYLANVKREDGHAEENRPICDQAIQYFDQKVETLLRDLPLAEEGTKASRVECADVLFSIATAFTWADSFDMTEMVLGRAEQLAKGTHIAPKIEERLKETRQAIERNKVFSGLTPINETPTLGEYQKFYGRSDPQPITLPDGSVEESHVTTHYFVIMGIPIFPMKRYRVVNKGDGRYRVLGSLPYSDGNKAHIAALVLAVVIFIVSQASSTPSSRFEPPPPPPVSGSSTAPDTTPPFSTTDTPTRSTPSPSPSSGSGYTSRSEREALKREIELEQSNLRDMESEIQTRQSQIESLKREIDDDEARMDLLRTSDRVTEYNRMVPEYNAKVAKTKRLIAIYNETIGLYKVKIDAMNSKINDYNLRASYGKR